MSSITWTYHIINSNVQYSARLHNKMLESVFSTLELEPLVASFHWTADYCSSYYYLAEESNIEKASNRQAS